MDYTKTELTEEWGHPILRTVCEDGSLLFWYPLVNDWQNPQLIVGRPYKIHSKNFVVSLFLPIENDSLPYLLGVVDLNACPQT